MEPTRILFVDDEPSLRATLPTIVEQHGFHVSAVATVPEALLAINTDKFDVLISDLNIGEPGDGFTVVSAMRRTQPRCVNFILRDIQPLKPPYKRFATKLTITWSSPQTYCSWWPC
jgi:DNA-binding NtrC family response regulator